MNKAIEAERRIRRKVSPKLYALLVIAGCWLDVPGAGLGVAPAIGQVGDVPSRSTEIIPGTLMQLEMIHLPGGTVAMESSEGPRQVEVGPFWIGVTEVTWDLYDLFVFGSGRGTDEPGAEEGVSRPSRPYVLPGDSFGHHGHPALGMTFLAAEHFTQWLSEQTGHSYRLPTEAEWEYACRAGGGSPEDLIGHAWHAATSSRRTHPVGTLAPNAFGLHDLLGNASEWVTTTDGEPVVKGGAYKDPPAQVSCDARSAWEESWQMTDPQLPKSRWWLSDAPFVGLRVVREP